MAEKKTVDAMSSWSRRELGLESEASTDLRVITDAELLDLVPKTEAPSLRSLLEVTDIPKGKEEEDSFNEINFEFKDILFALSGMPGYQNESDQNLDVVEAIHIQPEGPACLIQEVHGYVRYCYPYLHINILFRSCSSCLC